MKKISEEIIKMSDVKVYDIKGKEGELIKVIDLTESRQFMLWLYKERKKEFRKKMFYAFIILSLTLVIALLPRFLS